MDANKKRKLILDSVIGAVIIVVGIILDQITKFIAVKHLKEEFSVTFIDGLIDFTYVENRGMAWGLFADHRWVFMLVSTVAIIVVGVILFSGKSPSKLYSVFMACIISGGIGNMIDRVALGYVVDFIEATFIDFPVFNVADSFVTVGAFGLIILLVIDIVRESVAEAKKKKENGDKSND